MNYPGYKNKQRSANWTARGQLETSLDEIDNGDVHIRNYDMHYVYDLELELIASDGQTIREERWFLQPSQMELRTDIVPRRASELRVRLDNEQRATWNYQSGTEARRSVLVEVGNGILRLSPV